MSQNYIQIFDDTVVKFTINQGLEEQRSSSTLGAFNLAELAFTRDSGRVFVGDYSDDAHSYMQNTVGGTLVGNKYLGIIDSKTIEKFNTDPSDNVKPLLFEESTKVTNNINGSSEGESNNFTFNAENGVLKPMSKFKDKSNGFTYDVTTDDPSQLTEKNWSRWNRTSTYQPRYDAYDGDIMYDKFQNAIILFDHSVHPFNTTKLNEIKDDNCMAVPGWMHSQYGPSYKVFKGVSEPGYYLFAIQQETLKWIACTKDGVELNVEVDPKQVHAFYKGDSDPLQSEDSSEINWMEIHSNASCNAVNNNGEIVIEAASSPVYVQFIQNNYIPFYDQTESKNRTILINRNISDSESEANEYYNQTYGNGYVIFRNVEPDNKTIRFANRVGLQVEAKAINDLDETTYEPKFKSINTDDVLSSNVLEVCGLSERAISTSFSSDFSIDSRQRVQLSKDTPIKVNYISTTNEHLALPNRISFSSNLVQNVTEDNNAVTYTFNLNNNGMSTDTPEFLLSVTDNTIFKRAFDFDIPLQLSAGLVNGRNGSDIVNLKLGGENNGDFLKIDTNNETSSAGDAYDMPLDKEDAPVYDGQVRYVGNAVLNSSGNVIDSDKFYNNDWYDGVVSKYEDSNHPYNMLQRPIPLIWGSGSCAASFIAADGVYTVGKNQTATSQLNFLYDSIKDGNKFKQVMRIEKGDDSSMHSDTMFSFYQEDNKFITWEDDTVKFMGQIYNEVSSVMLVKENTDTTGLQLQKIIGQNYLSSFDVFNSCQSTTSKMYKYLRIAYVTPQGESAVAYINIYVSTKDVGRYVTANSNIEYGMNLGTMQFLSQNDKFTLTEAIESNGQVRINTFYGFDTNADIATAVLHDEFIFEMGDDKSVDEVMQDIENHIMNQQMPSAMRVSIRREDDTLEEADEIVFLFATDDKGVPVPSETLKDKEQYFAIPSNARSVILQLRTPTQITLNDNIVISTKATDTFIDSSFDIKDSSTPKYTMKTSDTDVDSSGNKIKYPTLSDDSEVAPDEKILIYTSTEGITTFEVPIHSESKEGAHYFNIIARNLPANANPILGGADSIINIIGYRA